MSQLNVNLDLVQKYNVAGPRYTSYPPATKFTDAVTWDQLSKKIESNNQTPRDLSVYFHIPFCETLCWFCGCTTVITLNHAQGMAYVESLGREVAKMAPLLNRDRTRRRPRICGSAFHAAPRPGNGVASSASAYSGPVPRPASSSTLRS